MLSQRCAEYSDADPMSTRPRQSSAIGEMIRLLSSRTRLILLVLPILPGVSLAEPIDKRMKVDRIYQTLCASCHGEKFEGGLGGSLVDGVWNYGGADDEIARSIAKGRLELGMTPWEGVLSPDQVRAMVVFLREREKEASVRGVPQPVARRDDSVVATRHVRFTLQTLTRDLEEPWGLAFLPDGRFLVTECTGALRIVAPDGRPEPAPVRGIPESVRHGQGGLMDVALHPDYARNGWVYLALADGTKQDGKAHTLTAIARGRIRDGAWVDHAWIWKGRPAWYSGSGVHFGSRIVFRDGYVFFVIGERGGWQVAQDLTKPMGKIFRLHDDGRVPADNPFADQPEAVPGIWSYGHRNPQGLVFDPRDGALYSTEHGPRGGDEFNLIRRGANYGWPVISHGINYDGTPFTSKTSQEGMEQPLLHWTPSIAACGLAYCSGDRYPGWNGQFFAGSLAKQELHRINVVEGRVVESELVLKGAGRIRDVKAGPDGYLYLLLNGPDRMVRLVPE